MDSQSAGATTRARPKGRSRDPECRLSLQSDRGSRWLARNAGHARFDVTALDLVLNPPPLFLPPPTRIPLFLEGVSCSSVDKSVELVPGGARKIPFARTSQKGWRIVLPSRMFLAT